MHRAPLASASSAAASMRGPVGFVFSLRAGAASWTASSGDVSGDDSAACWDESGLAAPFFRRIVRMRSDMEHLGYPLHIQLWVTGPLQTWR